MSQTMDVTQELDVRLPEACEVREEQRMTVQAQNTPQSVEALLARIAELEARVEALEQAPAQDIEDRLAMVVFSGDLDKALAAFIIATGAAEMGLEVSMFFTFWGLSVVRKGRRFEGKNLIQKAFGAMLPAGGETLHLSKMDFFGAGAALMRKIMRDHEGRGNLHWRCEPCQSHAVHLTIRCAKRGKHVPTIFSTCCNHSTGSTERSC